MVMALVHVTSKVANGVVGKVDIKARGPFCIIEDHYNGSYSMHPFNKSDSVIIKFMAQDLYILPPQILPCDDIDLPDFRYLNSDFAHIKHPLKDTFNIESYNSMWLDDTMQTRKPNLKEICNKVSPIVPPIVSLIIDLHPVDKPTPVISTSPPPTQRPDTIDEMDINQPDNAYSPPPSNMYAKRCTLTRK